MSAPHSEYSDELIDLLIKDATEGLTEEEKKELNMLQYEFPDFDVQFADDAVAALSLAMVGRGERLPRHLRDNILDAANAPNSMITEETEVASFEAARQRQEARKQPKRQSRTISASAGSAGWWAAAAALVLAVAGWWPRLTTNPNQQMAAANQEPTRQELLASGHAIRASWTPADAEAQPLVGDVVFDPVSQRGFLTFRGIPKNDPRLAQYQLWIVDAHRKQPEPVDGGVFNVSGTPTTSGNDVVIPFEAKLPIGQPAAFVVTLEQPGGVVISKQEKVLALAKVTT
jgi:hypothetical protein